MELAPALIGGEPKHLARCALCGAAEFQVGFADAGSKIEKCRSCGLAFRNPQPSDAVLATIYNEDYFLSAQTSEAMASALKHASARVYLDHIAAYRGRPATTLLEIGCGHGELLAESVRRGYACTAVELSATAAAAARAAAPTARVLHGALEDAGLRPGSFDVCILADVVEHVRDPRAFVQSIRRCLVPGGTILVVTPALDSWSALIMGRHWMEYKIEHLFYFNRSTLRRLLEDAGFGNIIIRPGRKALNVEYIAAHFERFPVPGFTPLLRWTARLMPRSLRQRAFLVHSSGITALAAVV